MFTKEEDNEIAKIYLSCKNAIKIAEMYGVGKTAIYNSLKRTNTSIQRGARKYYVNPNTFDIIDTPEKAYWWGFAYADGGTQRDSFKVELSGVDKGHLEKLKSFLDAEYPIYEYERESESGHKTYNKTRIIITDKHLVGRLKEIGITSGRKNINMGELPKELYRYFVLGYFDGNGSISRSTDCPQITFSSRTSDILKWIRNVISPYIRKYARTDKRTIQKHKTKNAYRIDYHGKNICKAIYEYMYKDETVSLDRKRKKFKKYFDK